MFFPPKIKNKKGDFAGSKIQKIIIVKIFPTFSVQKVLLTFFSKKKFVR